MKMNTMNLRSIMPSVVYVICYLSWLSLCCYYVNASSTTTSLSSSSTTKNNDSSLWKSFIDSDVYRNIYSDVPTLFSNNNNDVKYDRYAACLAATEGLRRIRDREITSIRNRRNNIKKADLSTREEKNIQSQFLKNSKQILDFHGISPRSFATLSKKLMYDEELKQKVIEQAYLYRVASSVQLDRWTMIDNNDDKRKKDLTVSVPSTTTTTTTTTTTNTKTKKKNKTTLHDFSNCLTEIERLRYVQMERLKRSLHIDTLPTNIDITDPTIQQLLNPKVRAVVNAFPLQVEQIITKKYGYDIQEFNQLLGKVKSNSFFRWRVQSLGKKMINKNSN